MPKGYWIAHVTVEDAQIYEDYKAANAAPFAEFGARFLVRAGTAEQVEGDLRPRTVVIEFASYADALACYESASYANARAIRQSVSASDLVIVEGYDG